jgi:hypothetical protein
MRHPGPCGDESRVHRTREQTRCQFEAKPIPSARCKGWLTLPDLDGGRSCGKFGIRAVLFPQWHARDLGEPSDYGPPVTANTRQGPCVY